MNDDAPAGVITVGYTDTLTSYVDNTVGHQLLELVDIKHVDGHVTLITRPAAVS